MTASSLAEVRAGIDAIDDRIVQLLAQRQEFVAQAARFKRDAAAVRAPGRRAAMMERLRIRAVEEGVSPEVVARVWTAMIDAFVELELAAHGCDGPLNR